MSGGLLDQVTCARCIGKVDLRAPTIACDRCGQEYPRAGRIPVLLPRPDAHVAFWRQQLAFVMVQGHRTLAGLEGQAAAEGLLPDTRARLLALAQGVRDQAEEIGGLVGPAIGGPVPASEMVALPPGADAPIQYLHYLYRDWGWDSDGQDENQATLEAVRDVIDPGPLGRMLVLGGGGCRLPYDLHRLCGATETVVVDVDPFLFIIAEAVVRGASVRLTESTANIRESGRAAIAWTLAAPAGPLDDAQFHFLFANGLAPPFADGAFDTVVTPWFIDQVPPDLPALLANIARLLRPGGRWINHGPLIYPADAPLSRRFGREEVFDLAARAGFEVRRSAGASRPYLVSPLNGRGKVEWVLTFEAVRLTSRDA
jgi:SAM-dependent methyltransferase